MKKILALIFVLMLSTACAYAQTADYQYADAGDGVHITAYKGSDVHIWIPDELGGQPVTGIGDGAFRGNTDIVTLHIPDSVKTIGVEAFQDCTALRDVHLGKGIERLKARAFTGCTALLNVALLTTDFYEDVTAFDEASDERAYNGAEIAGYWAEYADDAHGRLYVAAMELMYRGDFEAARDIFLSLYSYELSSDYYFYCSGRIYENQGDPEAALAIYGLMPDLYDCSERIDYYGGEAEMDYFFASPDYHMYYNEYFGEGGIYENWDQLTGGGSPEQTPVETPADAPEATETPIGGADGPTGIVVIGGALIPEGESLPADEPDSDTGAEAGVSVSIGGGLLHNGTDAEPVEAPAETPAPQPAVVLEDNPALMSYHDFTGIMPMEYSNYTNTDGYYVIYYALEDEQQVADYLKLFTDSGWQLMQSEEGDGWTYITAVTSDYGGYFYVSYSAASGIVGFMYESVIDYGFDPANDL